MFSEYGANVIRVNLGEIFLEQGDFQRSKNAFEKAFTFSEKCEIEGMLFVSTINLFNVSYEMKSMPIASLQTLLNSVIR